MIIPRTHKLKTLPEYFEAVLDKSKTFEIRRDDRAFKVGDTLILQEWVPEPESFSYPKSRYTGREIEVKVTYKTHGGLFGIADNYCVMGFVISGTKP